METKQIRTCSLFEGTPMLYEIGGEPFLCHTAAMDDNVQVDTQGGEGEM